MEKNARVVYRCRLSKETEEKYSSLQHSNNQLLTLLSSEKCKEETSPKKKIIIVQIANKCADAPARP